MKQFQIQSRRDLLMDLRTGVVLALLSVPLSTGFAAAAGLPPQYGLYGAFLPVLCYSLLTSSPRFVIGVDAAPAALTASLLAALEVAPVGREAVEVMPAVTLLVSFWLFLFWLLRGGRFAKFISEPVLGGCVSGIAAVMLLMQIPVLFGGSMGRGRGPVLLFHIFQEWEHIHLPSLLLGLATVCVVVLGRRRTKLSLSVVMMAAGILLTAVFHIDRLGIPLAASVPAGLPRLVPIRIGALGHHAEALLVDTLTAALVIAAETLVSTREMGRHYDDEIDNQRELLSYAAGNLCAALFGSSPVGGSLSRTSRANRRHVSSQWMGVSSAVTMGLFLLFGTPLLTLVPAPILTGIVIASLITIMDFPLALRLWRIDRPSFLIFTAAFAAELLGLSEGVLVGVVLSFASFTMRSTAQPSYFLGCVEGMEGFFDLDRTPPCQAHTGYAALSVSRGAVLRQH